MNYLNEEDRELFYKIHRRLLLFTNQTAKLGLPCKKPEDFIDLDNEGLSKVCQIRDHLFTHVELVDQFVEKNPFELSKDELELARGWELAVSGNFYMFRHLKKHTVFLHEGDDFAYGVIGISEPLEDYVPKYALPLLIKTAILPFKGVIIYDGIFQSYSITFGGGIKRSLTDTYNKSKARYGITTTLAEEDATALSNQEDEDKRMIEFYLQNQRNIEEYAGEAWQLAKKNKANMRCYNIALGKFYARSMKKLMKSQEITGLHVAMFRDCVVGVAKTPKEMEKLCKQNVPDKVEDLYSFKV